MYNLRIASICCAFLFFCGWAAAEETRVVTLKACPAKVSSSDPTIAREIQINGQLSCDLGKARVTIYHDRHYGFWIKQPLPGTKGEVEETEPMFEDILKTHKPCRIAYNDEHGKWLGVFDEWLIPQNSTCGVRPPVGSRARRYTPDEKICILAADGNGVEGCIPVTRLTSLGQARFKNALKKTYTPENLAMGH